MNTICEYEDNNIHERTQSCRFQCDQDVGVVSEWARYPLDRRLYWFRITAMSWNYRFALDIHSNGDTSLWGPRMISAGTLTRMFMIDSMASMPSVLSFASQLAVILQTSSYCMYQSHLHTLLTGIMSERWRLTIRSWNARLRALVPSSNSFKFRSK